jgi:hypothetical protein
MDNIQYHVKGWKFFLRNIPLLSDQDNTCEEKKNMITGSGVITGAFLFDEVFSSGIDFE